MVVSKSRSSASLTVIAPVPELMANGSSPSLSPSVLPEAMVQTSDVMSSSPVLSTSTTAAELAAVSAMLAAVSVTVNPTSVIVIVMTSVSAVVPSVAWTVRS